MPNAALINGLVTPYYGLVAVGRPLPVADEASASAVWIARLARGQPRARSAPRAERSRCAASESHAGAPYASGHQGADALWIGGRVDAVWVRPVGKRSPLPDGDREMRHAGR